VGTKMRHGYQNLIPTYIENVGGVTTNMKTAVSNALMLMPENSELISKRLHISGLTPVISFNDLL
jgi:hypothetical protein